jgi:hypothetical protein
VARLGRHRLVQCPSLVVQEVFWAIALCVGDRHSVGAWLSRLGVLLSIGKHSMGRWSGCRRVGGQVGAVREWRQRGLPYRCWAPWTNGAAGVARRLFYAHRQLVLRTTFGVLLVACRHVRHVRHEDYSGIATKREYPLFLRLCRPDLMCPCPCSCLLILAHRLVVSASPSTSWLWSAQQARTVCCCVDPRTTARLSSTSDLPLVSTASRREQSWRGSSSSSSISSLTLAARTACVAAESVCGLCCQLVGVLLAPRLGPALFVPVVQLHAHARVRHFAHFMVGVGVCFVTASLHQLAANVSACVSVALCCSGVPHSSTKPYVRAKGRKFEKARGRRKSRGYKA